MSDTPTTILDEPITDITTEAVNEVQKLTLGTAVPTEGKFTVTLDGETTDEVAFDASAATLQAAILNLSSYDDGDIVVAGDAKGPFTLTYGGAYAGVNVPAATATGKGLKATLEVLTPTVSTVTAGSPSADNPLAVQRGAGLADRTDNVSLLSGDSPAEDRAANKADYGDA